MANWKPMVKVGGEWAGNALVFATREEAEDNARELMGRWMLVVDTRADETDAPVNYQWKDRTLIPVEPKGDQVTIDWSTGQPVEKDDTSE